METLNQLATKGVVEKLGVALSDSGFQRRGHAFVREINDVIHVIGLQKSDVSNATFVRLTLNLGVYSLPLARKLGEDAFTPKLGTCHWECRIGFLMPEQNDSWWEVSDVESIFAVATDIVDVTIQYALPELARLSSTYDLIGEWRSMPTEEMSRITQNYLLLLSDL